MGITKLNPSKPPNCPQRSYFRLVSPSPSTASTIVGDATTSFCTTSPHRHQVERVLHTKFRVNKKAMAGGQIGILNSEHCPQFFKIYMPEHCSTQLGIPPAFVKYFNGCLPMKFILVTCATKSWEVDMNKVDDDVYIKRGWEKFVQDNLLEFGDFLVFYYDGGSKFYVSISGKNNCLKEIEVANNESEKQPTRIQGNETNRTGGSKRFSVKDSDLSFEVTMQQCYMTKGYINMPKVFTDGVKVHRSIAKLQHSGRTWEVKVGRSGGRVRFSQGWSLFVAENCLATGDACSFNMIDIKPEFYLFDVSFSREM